VVPITGRTNEAMADLDFSVVSATIIDRDPTTRTVVREMLRRFGLGRVRDIADIEQARGALVAGSPDLLLLDIGGATEPAFSLIDDLRARRVGDNPFVILMCMTSAPTPTLLGQITARGADDLLIKPFKPDTLRERIVGQIDSRKPFVVTSDYLGPERRKQARQGAPTAQEFQVPNTLRLKATGKYRGTDIGRAIRMAWESVEREQTVRQAFQMAFLAEFCVEGLEQTTPDRVTVDHLDRLRLMAMRMGERMAGDVSRSDHVDRCEELVRICDEIRAADSMILMQNVVGDMRLLSLDMAAALGKRDINATRSEIAVAVGRYRERLRSG
jgi:DNA-binding response OmpR family regulator